MAMSYSSLIAAKGTSGAIATWVNYTLLDIPPIVDEAQTLLYSMLRCREMLTEYNFSMGLNSSVIALPARFLDPVGRLYMTSFNREVRHKDSNYIQAIQTYSETSGTLGANPFTTTAGSDLVTVAFTGNGFTQGSLFSTTGATAFNGATISGTFPVTSVQTNSFVIDIGVLGTTPTSSGSGGGSAAAYTCDNLVYGMPTWYGIWNEQIHFDMAFSQACLCKMQYFQSLPLLSTDNETNFLTNRYPQIMRTACLAAAADFMKDDTEYQKYVARLGPMVQQISIENDMMMRGMELDTFTP